MFINNNVSDGDKGQCRQATPWLSQDLGEGEKATAKGNEPMVVHQQMYVPTNHVSDLWS